MSGQPGPGLPDRLAELVADFADVGPSDRLELLAELADELPAPPARYADAATTMERVAECQSPLFLAVEVGDGADRPVRLHFSAPREALTTRGFASIMHAGLDGEPAATVLAVPPDFHVALSLADVVSPLRLRGMTAMLARIQQQVRAATVAGGETGD